MPTGGAQRTRALKSRRMAGMVMAVLLVAGLGSGWTVAGISAARAQYSDAALSTIPPNWPSAELPAEVPPGYRPPPEKEVERGLWMETERVEQAIRTSRYHVRDPQMESYMQDIVCKLAPAYCHDIRVYLIRVADFNAMMAPNGFMQVWTGLLLRMRNEAELAAVLGHEVGHYLRRHSLHQAKRIRNTLSLTAFATVGLEAAKAKTKEIENVQILLLSRIFSFSRKQEREADAIGTILTANAGYDPAAGARVWETVMAEFPSTKHMKRAAVFATHPITPKRRARILDLAAKLHPARRELYRERFLKVRAPLEGMLWQDQLEKGTVYRTIALAERLLREGDRSAKALCVNAEALRRRGNLGDGPTALKFYREAVASGEELFPWCWKGYGLAAVRWSMQPGEAQKALATYLKLVPDAPDRQALEFYLQDDKVTP